MRCLRLRRHTEQAVEQEIWASAQTVFVAEDEPLGLAVNIWTFVVFTELESVVVEALRSAEVDPQLVDKRSARFSLAALMGPGDPKCVQGLLLDPQALSQTQAEYAWSFYWDRAAQPLDWLSSVAVLSDVHYRPPGVSAVSWRTRQFLHNAQRGEFELAQALEQDNERLAPDELMAPINALSAGAAAKRGHEFIPRLGALDYRLSPPWLEFQAVRAFVAGMAHP